MGKPDVDDAGCCGRGSDTSRLIASMTSIGAVAAAAAEEVVMVVAEIE